MNDKLGILVSSDKYIDHLIGITKAAHRAGKKVSIFLTNRAVLLTKNERFTELDGICHVSLCSLCFESFKVDKPVPVVNDKDFATQMRNVVIMKDCDRYIVL
jgi:peroxiredoxin family protein